MTAASSDCWPADAVIASTSWVFGWTTTTAPSITRMERTTSAVKSICPGVSMSLMRCCFQWQAVAAAVMALAADLTREENRTKAMALIGISIGMAFMIALVAGPILYKSISVPGMFWLTAALAVAGILVVLFVVPTPEHSAIHRDAEVVSGQVSRVLANVDLLRLDLGIFVLHLIMTALFLAYPLLLRDMGGIASEDHWTIYLPVLVLSIMLMVPFIIIAEKRGKIKQVFLLAIIALSLGLFGMGEFASGKWGLVGWLLLFFTAFNLLEASLPSLISKIAPADAKGTAMGVYSTSQFAGAFFGGAAGGWIHQQFGAQAVLLFGAGMAVLWLLFAAGMRAPEPLKPRLVNIRNMPGSSSEISELFHRIAGVREVVIAPDEGVAYLKVDSKKLDEEALEAYAPLWGWVPLDRYDQLREENESLKAELSEQARLIKRLDALMEDEDMGHMTMVARFQNLIADQSKAFDDLMQKIVPPSEAPDENQT